MKGNESGMAFMCNRQQNMVTTCLENQEISGNLIAVGKMSGS